MNQLAVLFELNLRTVRKYLLRTPQDAQVPGRHWALDEMFESELTTVIIQAFKQGKDGGEEATLWIGPWEVFYWAHQWRLNAVLNFHLDAFQICRLLLQKDKTLSRMTWHSLIDQF
jgi:hypothetical protein